MNPLELKQKYIDILRDCLERLEDAGYPVTKEFSKSPGYVLHMLADHSLHPRKPKLSVKSFRVWLTSYYETVKEMLGNVEAAWDKDWDTAVEGFYTCRSVSCNECPFKQGNLPPGMSCDMLFSKTDKVESLNALQTYLDLYEISNWRRRQLEKETMEPEDFKVIIAQHVETCQQIIALGGRCSSIDCAKCPFRPANLVCSSSAKAPCGGYADAIASCETDYVLERSCRRFIEMYNKYDKLVTEGEINE